MKKAREHMNIRETVLSCMLGLAVGDALGVPFEFMPRRQAESAELTHMHPSSFFHGQPAGAWSDDTAMALASMDSLTRSRGFDPEDMMAAFLDWYRNAAYTSTDVTFGVGGTVFRALHRAQAGVPALRCGLTGIRDNGNGSLMRFAPVALYCICRDLPRKEELRLVGEASAITHGHAISKLGCQIYTDFLRVLINGGDKETAYRTICAKDYTAYYPAIAVKAYERIFDGALADLPRRFLRESGYVVDTLEAALWVTLREDSYENAVGEAIRLGYDADTVAAVTGSLCGVLYGVDGIPRAWRDELLKRPYLETLCEQFSATLL